MHYYKNNMVDAIQVSDLASKLLNNRGALPEWILNRYQMGRLRLTSSSGVVFVNEYNQEIETGSKNWIYLDPTGVVRTLTHEAFNEHFTDRIDKV